MSKQKKLRLPKVYSETIDVKGAGEVRFGVHVSITSGWGKVLEEANRAGCETMQVFVKNPRGWAGKPLDLVEVNRFRATRSLTGITPLVVHTSYLINIPSGKEELRIKSHKGFLNELVRADAIGADYIVMHPGSWSGWTKEEGTSHLSAVLRDALRETMNSSVSILLENVSGSGNELGRTFEELAEIIDYAGSSDRLGVCLDTCHAYSCGYDISSADELEMVLEWFNSVIGLQRLKLIHLNDSKGGRGSHTDRHEHIGRGCIGLDAITRIINHPALSHLPAILETPQDHPDDDQKNLCLVKSVDSLGSHA